MKKTVAIKPLEALLSYNKIMEGGASMVITKDMTIQEVVENNPETIRVFLEHGLHCVGCSVARFENIEQGAMAHGIDVDTLMKDLNAKVEAGG
jgi:hybrid cluster-associated redox disulfide protein